MYFFCLTVVHDQQVINKFVTGPGQLKGQVTFWKLLCVGSVHELTIPRYMFFKIKICIHSCNCITNFYMQHSGLCSGCYTKKKRTGSQSRFQQVSQSQILCKYHSIYMFIKEQNCLFFCSGHHLKHLKQWPPLSFQVME